MNLKSLFVDNKNMCHNPPHNLPLKFKLFAKDEIQTVISPLKYILH